MLRWIGRSAGDVNFGAVGLPIQHRGEDSAIHL
jgi:hypothetical protein